MQDKDTELLTIREAATELQVSRSTIYRWFGMNRLTPIHLGPAHKLHRPIRVARAEIEALKRTSAE